MNISINVNGTISTIQLTNDTTSSLLLAGGEILYYACVRMYVLLPRANDNNIV